MSAWSEPFRYFDVGLQPFRVQRPCPFLEADAVTSALDAQDRRGVGGDETCADYVFLVEAQALDHLDVILGHLEANQAQFLVVDVFHGVTARRRE